MKRKYRRMLWLGFWIVYLILILSFVNKENHRIICKDIRINITDKTGYNFINTQTVRSMLQNKNYQLIDRNLDSLNLEELECYLRTNPCIKKAETYCNIDGILSVNIEQREPIARIINQNNESCYIDKEGYLMPLSANYTARVLVFSGNFTGSPGNHFHKCLAEKDTTLPLLFRDMYVLADFIYHHEFWSAQIEQIYVNFRNEFELIPKTGEQVIILGDINNYQQKFKKLITLYKKGFYNIGWNQYKSINLTYKNQIVCKKDTTYGTE